MMQLYKYAFSIQGPAGPDGHTPMVSVGKAGERFDSSHALPSLKDGRIWSYKFDEGSDTTGVLFTESPLY